MATGAGEGLHTRAGFTALVAATRTRFGSTMVAGGHRLPRLRRHHHARPGQSFLFRGGYAEPSNAGTRTASDPLVALGAVRVDAVLGLVAGAGETLAGSNPTSRYLIVGCATTDPPLR